MKNVKTFFKQEDGLITTGLILILFSASLFGLTSQVFQRHDHGIFFINYLITTGYSLAVFIKTIVYRKKYLEQNKLCIENNSHYLRENKLKYSTLILVLGFISAFALNREMNIFDTSVNWLCIYIILSSIAILLCAFSGSFPGSFSNTFKYFIYFLLGSGFIMFLYYAIYLLPLYIISVPGLLALGISIHTYVPALLAIVTFALFLNEFRHNMRVGYAFASGALLPIVLGSAFLILWHDTNARINQILNQQTLNEGKLPPWVVVSQKIKKSFIADRILKMGLLYYEVDLSHNRFFQVPSTSLDQPKLHDPLVVVASLMFKKPNLDENDRINVMKSMYDSRHHAQDRLWSGDELETASVITNVKLFPEYRMAYTEKTLTIRNNSIGDWNTQQEAIYTFHLSEGSAVTSLSLWINGREEKSRLTTKATADSTYKQIVGVENHDPSVVHWQEGNTVTVRVFPCTIKENRKFRIGISSPLHKIDDRLVYENIYFEGPAAEQTLETVQLSFSKKPEQLHLTDNYIEVSPNVFQTERNYEPYWEIACKAPSISDQGFSFEGFNYVVKEYKPEYARFDPLIIYLDLNSSWSKSDFMEVWEHLKSKPIYVYLDGLKRLDQGNLEQIYNQTRGDNFSLFPVNEIADPTTALIISKSTAVSPNFQDLEGSDFAKSIIKYLKAPKQIRLYNIGDQVSPYLKALKELHVFNYDQGLSTSLFDHLKRHEFIQPQEDDSTVVIDHAKLMIHQVNKVQTGSAPDHLLRLFAYNDIMKKIGGDYFNKDFVRTDIMNEAEKANVASPVSSLLVLETKKDYDRFNIQASKNSLENASMKSSGAVPEPHEWLLILLVLIIASYLFMSKKHPEYEH